MNMAQKLANISCCGFDAHSQAGMDLLVLIFFTAVLLRDAFFLDMTLGHWVIRS